MFDFFLSHNRAEKDWTRQLAKALRTRGAGVFFDEDSIKIGDDIVSIISHSLQNSKHVALVLSPRSVASQWVELEWASSLYSDPGAVSRRVLPILIEDCDIPFVLKRLHHLNACDLSGEECADALMKSIKSESGDSASVVRLRSKVSTSHAPIGFTEHYLERRVDQLATRAISSSRAAFVYGPRRIGKTSLLRRQRSRAQLSGIPIVWIDLSHIMSREDIEQAFYQEIIRSLRPRELRARTHTDTGSLRHRATDCLAEAADGSESKQVLLLLDEVDAALMSGKGEPFAYSLREMLANPAATYLQCVAVGFNPPWMWQERAPVSPYWNNFAVIPMSYFDESQVITFLANYQVGESTARALYEYTGGNPPQIMDAVSASQDGVNLREVLDNPLSRAGPLVSWNEWMFYAARPFIESQRLLGGALLRGERVDSRSDRLALWLHGLIRDPDSNPPEVLGTQVYEILRELKVS